MMIRLLFLLMGLCSAMTMAAQSKFSVNGRLKIEGGELTGAKAVIYRNGTHERTINSGLNKFSLDLDLGANYIIAFEKEGYVAKKIAFNTNVPTNVPAHAFAPFEFSVSLFKQYDNVNLVVFNQPVGVIRYEASKQDFDYDMDYTKSIQSQLQQAMAELEQQRKEEARQASAEAKRKAAEEKQRAREEAEAQREAQARAEQERAEQQRKEAEQARVADTKEVKPAPPAQRPMVHQAETLPPPKRDHAPTEHRRTLAHATEGMVPPPPPAMEEEPAVREEELIVEPNKVITIIRVDRGGAVTEYRRVSHKWGDVFFFKNGNTCSRLVYEQEALGDRDRLVDAMPRGRTDR